MVAISDDLWAELKIHCLRRRLKVSEALSEAVVSYLNAAQKTTRAA